VYPNFEGTQLGVGDLIIFCHINILVLLLDQPFTLFEKRVVFLFLVMRAVSMFYAVVTNLNYYHSFSVVDRLIGTLHLADVFLIYSL